MAAGALTALMAASDGQMGWALFGIGMIWNGLVGYVFGGIATAVFDIAVNAQK